MGSDSLMLVLAGALLSLLLLPRPSQGSESVLCSEQHFCSCPPFLRARTKPDTELHFIKHNYIEQYAIVGKSKELHCCVGPEYESMEWFKDDKAYPWHAEGDRNIILYSNNQSMIMMEVRQKDSGIYKCVARHGSESLEHSTNLSSFPAPVFAHAPIWNVPPRDVSAVVGEPVILKCSAIVGQQYNSMEPVQAAWVRYDRILTETPGLEVVHDWDEDKIVTHLSLEIVSLDVKDGGDYTCRVQNQYGVMEKTVRLTVENRTMKDKKEKHSLNSELMTLVNKQMKLLTHFIRVSAQEPEEAASIMKALEKKISTA